MLSWLKRKVRKRTLWHLLFFAYLLVLFRITVFRSGWYSNGFMSGTIEWVPFQTIFRYLTEGQIGYFIYLFVGNLVWFVPFGVFLRFRGMAVWKALLLTAVLSAVIEALQYVFGTGYTETEDVLLNTTGGAIGIGIASLCFMCRRKRGNKASQV